MDNRSKKMVLISHCLCNTNSKVCGFSPQSCSEHHLLAELFSKGYGIIQLPCPENRVYGNKRWGQSREQFNNPHFKRECTNMLLPFIDEIRDYLENGYDIAGVISVLGSPSCGYKASYSNDSYGGELDFETVEAQISSGKVSHLPGIFMTEFYKLFEKYSIEIPFIDFNEEKPEESLQAILRMLE
ncbi:MAG: CD3072 family TudS-related putative desulfidase [Proteocatella sp.]